MKTFEPTASAKKPNDLWKAAGLNSADGVEILHQIHEGLEGQIANRIAKWAHISQLDFRKMTGIPNTTFNRSLKDRFTANQSEKIVRVIRVLARAVELFEGDKQAAQKWLNEPNRALNWKTPSELTSSETGAYEVINLITRIEHGVYS
ncbi:type II RES/Xre toxin-antitoxin system antitoxin [Erwinia sp. V71]|uniref:type II RES/Xre toxin-antitoxin system antitoxin n=1 Tax=Erwinia sp. V71 TaxID=3369424 RepID=UPI003F602634